MTDELTTHDVDEPMKLREESLTGNGVDGSAGPVETHEPAISANNVFLLNMPRAYREASLQGNIVDQSSGPIELRGASISANNVFVLAAPPTLMN